MLRWRTCSVEHKLKHFSRVGVLQVMVTGDIPDTVRDTACLKYHQERYRYFPHLRGGREGFAGQKHPIPQWNVMAVGDRKNPSDSTGSHVGGTQGEHLPGMGWGGSPAALHCRCGWSHVKLGRPWGAPGEQVYEIPLSSKPFARVGEGLPLQSQVKRRAGGKG